MDAEPPPPDQPVPLAGTDAAAPPLGADRPDAAAPPPDRPVSLAGGEWLDGLARWAAEERVDEAARRRTAQRRHSEAEAAETTVASLLRRLAEGARTVLVDTVAGNRMRGRIVAVGADFCVIAAASGQVMAPTTAIAAVSEAPGTSEVSGDSPPLVPESPFEDRPRETGPDFANKTFRPEPALGDNSREEGPTFGEALTALAAERPLVHIAAGGRHWRGRLASAGADVVSVAAEPGIGGSAASHIAVAAIDHLVILDR